ncbi:large-conductance mechanosensitive channel protein MscL [Legionella jordanis]|uniref:Large-conductance mechanosensitive channel n=1 Tax=Legionella jordanis TaxID=456 RepID=A0A0W0V8P0_9GAMM|nr:large-conductance mechanosensitive channel protein MscL [Legionella jordanis]KTD16513.1 large conductance mechanosensitive channel [Legionella jordanis]RMX03941.1 large-conductance mechanosensitive channel protein MscL [Legionella jordanis]RMX21990.1 large-conductance mechanosensitive channel protein MscL [Legionella jordanis]VEH12026.1 large conductance mechanosensitive channel, MscL family [Legionella jordanis]HAT8712672.1 large-conductance mechanosensitive channel protein MscL [Legionell
MSFWSEFKEFAMRGNVIDLAVAVVIGAAFGKIVSSLVDGIIMPVIGLLLGGINISEKAFKIGAAVIKWGAFLQNIIDFSIIAFAIFVAVKFINFLQIKRQEEAEKLTRGEAILLEIRDLLKTNFRDQDKH